MRAREAAELCTAMGKRLCDAHEWEGACAGSLEPPDYRFDLAVGVSPNAAVERMRKAHNQAHEADKTWSYGPTYRTGVCAAGSHKSPTCDGGGWSLCGSNTYPTGAFPDCHSPLGVYDINGNAAEHMNLPLAADADGEPRQQGARLHRDEGQLVHLRQLPGARGLVPLARAVLARQPGDGPQEPRQLSPGLSLLQDSGRRD